MHPAMPAKSKKVEERKISSAHDWRTSDADEILKRQTRAREEEFRIINLSPAHRIYSDFEVKSSSGLSYTVEIHDIRERRFSCSCVDFRINGLGTCKHSEAVLFYLERRFRQEFRTAAAGHSDRVDITVETDSGKLLARNGGGSLPRGLRRWFDERGLLLDHSPEETIEKLDAIRQSKMPWLLISV
jgi:hypothetical protein